MCCIGLEPNLLLESNRCGAARGLRMFMFMPHALLDWVLMGSAFFGDASVAVGVPDGIMCCLLRQSARDVAPSVTEQVPRGRIVTWPQPQILVCLPSPPTMS